MTHEYLFIICPNASGSTLWTKLIGTSPNTSMFDVPQHEGQNLKGASQFLATPRGTETGLWTNNEEKFTNDNNYNWPALKALWEANWDTSKPVLVEKSPPNVLRTRLLAKHFQPAKFVFSIRNPYAVCESMHRKNMHKPTWEMCAAHWARCAHWQMHNVSDMKDSVYFTYEQLCDNTDLVVQRLLEFIPALVSIDVSRQFAIHSHNKPISNLNAASIARLTPEAIMAINSVLKNYPEELRFHGYSLM